MRITTVLITNAAGVERVVVDRFAGHRVQQRHLPAVLVDRLASGVDVATQRHVRGVGAGCDQFVGDDVGRQALADATEIDRQTFVEPHPVVRDLQSVETGRRVCAATAPDGRFVCSTISAKVRS